jgi:hypothetical protein
MYVIVHHRFTNPPSALERGMKLIKERGRASGDDRTAVLPEP